MFEWLIGPNAATKARLDRELEEARKPKPSVTIGDLISQLLQFGRDTQMTVTDIDATTVLGNRHSNKDIDVVIANTLEAVDIYPLRLLVECEPGFVEGLPNSAPDYEVKPFVWFKFVNRYDTPPITVADFLSTLYEMDAECVLAHQGEDPQTIPGTSIALYEFQPVRELLPGEPGYFAGIQNKTFVDTKIASLFINGIDWSKHSY